MGTPGGPFGWHRCPPARTLVAMTEPTDSPTDLDAQIENDPDGDPGNLNPRDDRPGA